ncbi:HAD-IA family hydrolase [Actinokineospora sp.]|uniref:HAD-IA family hydrolase n=1 Tax=Actinokineospora sp. TaxID=1872133 RepID=UPI003D6AD341
MRYEALVVDYAGVFTDPAIVDVVRSARAKGLRTALLSNADRRPYGLPDLFDAVIVSGEVGVAKPNPAIYELAAKSLATTPDRCVFIDDVARYVRGAAEAGMTGIHHRAVESTMDELAVLLDL